MSQPFVDDMDMDGLPASFLAQLQPAGAFLHSQTASNALQSPTALVQRHGGVAPPMTPLAYDARAAQLAFMPTEKAVASGDVAMSFMSAMRRGLDGLQDSDDDDDDDDDGAEGGYYQPAYSQYHAPTTSLTGRTSLPPLTSEEDELIFAMDM